MFAGLDEVSEPMASPERMCEPLIEAPVDLVTTDHYSLTPIA
ncbi:MAG: hypothetical protein WA948_08365 [Pontixanthobacter sp.]